MLAYALTRLQRFPATQRSFAAILAIFALPLAAQAVEPDIRTLDRLHSGILRDELQVLGANSCAAASCHGGPQPGVVNLRARRGNEYPLWFERDPHAQSWRTICNDQSLTMMGRLGIFRDGQIVDIARFNNCLACHNSTPLQSTAALNEPSISSAGSPGWQAEGVGCAGCHGPAEEWIGEHYQVRGRPEQPFDNGFVPLGDWLTRARTCVACHVGDRDRDVNHDLIAAGHPALRFDMATYHAWLPKHWRDAEAADPAGYESRLWLTGAVAAADASIALLEARATDATAVSTWPEFAAYDCTSCHHDLSLGISRRPRIDSPRPGTDRLGTDQSGLAEYAIWDRADLEQLLAYRRERGEWTTADRGLAGSLEKIEELMESEVQPDRREVAEAAAEARRRLAWWAEGSATSPSVSRTHGVARGAFDAASLMDVVRIASRNAETFQSWESSAQFYLSLIASRGGWPSGPASPISPLAARLRVGLGFPAERDSPRFSSLGIGRQPASREQIQRWAEQIGRALQTAAQSNHHTGYAHP